MNTLTELVTRTPTSDRACAALARAWRGLPASEKLAVALCPWFATGLLLAFAMACQTSVLRGERLRAEMRAASPVTVAQLTTTVPARPL